MKKVGEKFFFEPGNWLNRQNKAIFDNIVATFGFFEQIDLTVFLLESVKTEFLKVNTEENCKHHLKIAKIAQKSVLKAVNQWKALVPPKTDFSERFCSFHNALHIAINAFFDFCIEKYIPTETRIEKAQNDGVYKDLENTKLKNSRFFLKALKSRKKVFRPKFFSENLVEILKIKKEKSGNEEERVVNLTEKWKLLSKIYKNFHKINQSIESFVNSVTMIKVFIYVFKK